MRMEVEKKSIRTRSRIKEAVVVKSVSTGQAASTVPGVVVTPESATYDTMYSTYVVLYWRRMKSECGRPA